MATVEEQIAALTDRIADLEGLRVLSADILDRLSALLGRRNLTQEEVQAWWNGPADGGPDGDGLYPFTDSTGYVRKLPSPAKIIADLGSLSGGGGGGGGTGVGSGLVPYTVGTSAANSIIHQDVPVGTTLRSAFATATHEAQSGRMGSGGASWRAIAGVPGQLGAIGYDAALKRIVREGAVRRWEFVPDGAIHMSQLGLRAGDTADTLGQEALFAVVRDYVLNQHTLQSDNGILGPKVEADGIMWTDQGDIDLRLMQFTPGSSFKFFAKNGIKKDGVDVPRPVVRRGRGTSPQNRFTLPSDVDLYVDGDQTSELANLTTRVVGVEHYDDTGSSSSIRYRTSRLYIGARIFGNSEKQKLVVGGAYNDILVDYAQPYVQINDYAPAGLTGADLDAARRELMQYILVGDDDRRGWQGEWNPELNQQGIVSGGYGPRTIEGVAMAPLPAPLKGAFYRIKTAGGTVVIPTAIDGRADWANDRYIVFDGARWWQMRNLSNSPDSNWIEISGSDNEVIFRTPINGDSSGRLVGEHEGRRDRGALRRAYFSLRSDGSPEDFLIPVPAIWDRHGKHMIYGPLWVRGGDQRVGGFSGKDGRVDTSGFELSTENLHGVNWWWDRINKIYGRCTFVGGGNGRIRGGAAVPEYNYVARLNDVLDAGSLILDISEKVSDIGVVFGDELRNLMPRGLKVHLVNVRMGGGASPDPRNHTAIQVRAAQGLHIVTGKLEGRLDYRAGAQGVHHEIPGDWMLSGSELRCDVAADVGLKLAGQSGAADLFGFEFGNVRYAQVESVADERGTGAIYQEGKWEFYSRPPASQLALDSLNSNQNRYFKRASANEMHKTRFIPVYSTGDSATALWQDAVGNVVNSVDPRTGTASVRLVERTRRFLDRIATAPPDQWVNDLDRFVFEATECGAFPLDPLDRAFFDFLFPLWAPTREIARMDLMGGPDLIEVNPQNLAFLPYRGFRSTGDNYDAERNFLSVRADAGYLQTGYDPATASRGMGVDDMHAGAYGLDSHKANAGDIGSFDDRLYVRCRDTEAAGVQLGLAGIDNRLSSGPADGGYPPRHVLGLARQAGEQRIYTGGVFRRSGGRGAAQSPGAITLLQSAGDPQMGLTRHSPRLLGMAHVGRAFPEAVIAPFVRASDAFERATRKLAG